ncbi:MAG: hypothetical protein HY761_01390 [Candidatus Omnitrophica bacterium]|nr:hypothetical protein [Candidatus Omnitrophota bacterium]
MADENRLLSAIVADYVVASNRNHGINEQKSTFIVKGTPVIYLSHNGVCNYMDFFTSLRLSLEEIMIS